MVAFTNNSLTIDLSSVTTVDSDLPSCKLPFVWKLYEMLEDMERIGNEHIISWLSNGKGFKVHDLSAFVDRVIPRYFKQSKYKVSGILVTFGCMVLFEFCSQDDLMNFLMRSPFCVNFTSMSSSAFHLGRTKEPTTIPSLLVESRPCAYQ